MIPKVRRWRISFFENKTSAKPYAQIYASAPTKLLARLNAAHGPETAGAYYDAIMKAPRKIVYGIVKS